MSYVIDKAHGQRIPTGVHLARVLRGIMRRLFTDARWQLGSSRRVNFFHWVDVIAQASAPILLREFQRAYQRREMAIRMQVRQRNRKNLRSSWTLDHSFDVFRPEVIQAVQQAAFQFAQSTLATLSVQVEELRPLITQHFTEALQAGESMREINRRMAQLFLDPMKAARIGQTETSRAMHAGALMAAKDSGVVGGLKWLASSDACDRCLELNGKEVGLDEPFYVDPKGGPYAVVYHPPLHPHCMCTTQDVIDVSGVTGVNFDMAGRGVY